MDGESLGFIFLNAAVINNFVLALFLGICPFLGVSAKRATAWNMGLAVIFVMLVSSISAYGINWLLTRFEIEFLRLICYIAVIASAVQLVEMTMKKFSPALFRALGIFLPLITTNCAVLGVALLNVQQHLNFIGSAVYGFGAAVGFSLVLILFSAIRERVAAADVPVPFRGSAIALVTAGLMSLAFMGFSGLVKG